jgi:hypothetical protein
MHQAGFGEIDPSAVIFHPARKAAQPPLIVFKVKSDNVNFFVDECYLVHFWLL